MKYVFENGEGNSEKMTPMLIEKAVGFFLENQMMGDIAHGGEFIKAPISHDLRTDFVVGDTCIEMKVLMSKQAEMNLGNLLHLLVPNKRYYTALKEHYKRVVLLVVCEEGACEGQMGESSIYKEVGKDLEEELEQGVEVWISGIRIEKDGIVLVSYQKIVPSD